MFSLRINLVFQANNASYVICHTDPKRLDCEHWFSLNTKAISSNWSFPVSLRWQRGGRKDGFLLKYDRSWNVLNIWERNYVYLQRQQGILKPYKVFPKHLCPNFMLSLGATVCCSQIEYEEMLAQNSEQRGEHPPVGVGPSKVWHSFWRTFVTISPKPTVNPVRGASHQIRLWSRKRKE